MLLLGWKVWREAERQKQDRVGLERRLENEKEKLLRHITKYGHGCWSSVPKQAGN